MMTEPDVALTDYGLAIECALFSVLLHRQGSSQHSLRGWCVLFFGATGVAALAGGTVHGFFLDPATVGHAVLWPLTLMAIGLTALATWMLGAGLLLSVRVRRWITLSVTLELIAYRALVLCVTRTFLLAVVNYLAATLFLLVALAVVYQRQRQRGVLVMLAGLLLTFTAAWVQTARIGLHPTYFSYNALYHVIQAAALFLIFRGARQLTQHQGR